jgi:hypothetical protein
MPACATGVCGDTGGAKTASCGLGRIPAQAAPGAAQSEVPALVEQAYRRAPGGTTRNRSDSPIGFDKLGCLAPTGAMCALRPSRMGLETAAPPAVSGDGMAGERTALVEVAPGEVGESLSAIRLCVPEAQEQMQRSLSRLGQLTALQAYRVGEKLEAFDGVKRLRAALALSWPKVRVEVHELDSVGAKVRLLWCNATGGLSDLEVAWVVRSMYRDEKLSQPRIAQLLGHDKSWVCRKLTLAEGLSDELTASVRLGLLCARAAVELARLPRGNQDAAAAVVMRRGLTTRQTASLVDVLLQAAQDQWPKLLEQASLPASPAGPKGGALRRTPGEQLVADSWALKRLATRLHARLLERSLRSLGEPACAVVIRELTELRSTLGALTRTLDQRLGQQGASDAAA